MTPVAAAAASAATVVATAAPTAVAASAAAGAASAAVGAESVAAGALEGLPHMNYLIKQHTDYVRVVQGEHIYRTHTTHSVCIMKF